MAIEVGAGAVGETPAAESTLLRVPDVRISYPSIPPSTPAGTLVVTSTTLRWISADGSCGISAGFCDILLHAVARDAPSGPCIYCQVVAGDDDGAEMRLAPANESALEGLFEAMCEAAAACIDDDADDGGDDGFGEGYAGEGELDVGDTGSLPLPSGMMYTADGVRSIEEIMAANANGGTAEEMTDEGDDGRFDDADEVNEGDSRES